MGPEHERTNPWRTLSSREVYRNAWIRVREDEVLRPDGSPGIYGVVSTALAVGVLALTEDDEVVLVGQWRYTLGRHSWEIVEGGAHPGESGLAAGRRELAEEAGYAAATWQRIGGELALSNSVTDEQAELWLARDLRPVPRAPEPTEDIEIRHLPFAQAVALVDRGGITDSMSVVALLAEDRRRRVAEDPRRRAAATGGRAAADEHHAETLLIVGGPAACRPAARRVAALAREAGLLTELGPGLELAIHEILVNAVEHGHSGDHDAPVEVVLRRQAHRGSGAQPGRDHRTGEPPAITAAREPVPGLRIEITDRNRGGWDGRWEDRVHPHGPAGAHPAGPAGPLPGGPRPRGRGLALARAAVDDLQVHVGPRGTTVVLALRGPVAAPVAGPGSVAGPAPVAGSGSVVHPSTEPDGYRAGCQPGR